MKKLIGITLVMVLAATVALPVLGSPPGDGLHGSPWSTEVPVTMEIAEMTELWMDNNAVALNITDGGAVNDDSRAIRSVTYLSNCPIDVSVQIDGDIIDGTYFHIVVNPDVPATWNFEGPYDIQEKHIYFLRQNDAYSGNTPGVDYPAFSRAASTSAATVPVVYGAQISPAGVVPTSGTTANFTVVWTIAPGN